MATNEIESNIMSDLTAINLQSEPISSSQTSLVSTASTASISNLNDEFKWIFLYTFSLSERKEFIKYHQYKTVCSHGKQQRACSIVENNHSTLDQHQMYAYTYKCASSLCFRDKNDKCPFQFQIRHCLQADKHFIYRVYILKWTINEI
jgi:hypothetical protein